MNVLPILSKGLAWVADLLDGLNDWCVAEITRQDKQPPLSDFEMLSEAFPVIPISHSDFYWKAWPAWGRSDGKHVRHFTVALDGELRSIIEVADDDIGDWLRTRGQTSEPVYFMPEDEALIREVLAVLEPGESIGIDYTCSGPDSEKMTAADYVAKIRKYGGTGPSRNTIHATGHLDVETDRTGRVVSVWFRCQMLPFKQTKVNDNRAMSMLRTEDNSTLPVIDSINLLDDAS